MFYLPFSGGKFISNCLALSRHAVVGRPDLAHRDLCFENVSAEYYQLKLNNVLESLSKSFHITGKWYEFWDLDIPPTYKNGFGHVVELARSKQRTLTHNVHWNTDLLEYKQRFQDLKVIRLENFSKFNSHCFTLKSQDTDLERHQQGFESWVSNGPLGDVSIDIDSMMTDSDFFLSEIQKLYSFFNFDDYRPELLLPFYQKYLELHTLPK